MKWNLTLKCSGTCFASIPSLENPDHSILDEFYWLNKEDPCYAKTRVICNRGKALPNDGQLTLSEKAIKEMIDLILMPESKLEKCSNRPSF